MNKYSEEQILKIAKRYNNSKRKYLLVDPLQAKHIPVSPCAALELMHTLGKAVQEKYPESFLVIGFAETATAISSAVAENFKDCFYIQTTRENICGNNFLEFEEQHSHAVEQKLLLDNIEDAIRNSPQLIFADDEITTGNTLLNIVGCIRNKYPEIKSKKIVIASVINRISDKNAQKLNENNIDCVSLLRINECDYEKDIAEINVNAPDPIYFDAEIDLPYINTETRNKLPDPRIGLKISDYLKGLDAFSDEIMTQIKIEVNEKILVLGTEECMYPALIFGKRLEEKYNADVKCHSTTRSPIGISLRSDYPINNGYQINSFYNDKRVTFIYNIKKYDKVIIVTDSRKKTRAMQSLCAVLKNHGCEKIILIRG